MIARVRARARWVKHALTRTLHPVRRARALHHLERGGPVRSVLFICLGNVCRSPYAEASFRRMAPKAGAKSAGFIGPGRPAPEDAQRIARERGLDVSSHVSRLVTSSMVRSHDLIVVMEPRQRSMLHRAAGGEPLVIALGDLDPMRPDRRGIRDPWGQGADVFRDSFERIDRCLREILPFVAPPEPESETENIRVR